MRKRSIELEKQVVMVLTFILLLGSGCEDRIDTRGNLSAGEGMPVEVTFRIGLADETDAYALSGTPATKVPKASNLSDGTPAFSYALTPSSETKAATSLKPAALYNLEIRQYKGTDGTYLDGSGTVATSAATGSSITITLREATKCHLVLVAWGEGNTERLGTVALSEAQKISISNAKISDLNPSTQADMNKMPYMLHLTDVNVASDGRIYSADGEAIDVRLLLRRLATRLTFDWTYSVTIPGSTYTLNQILLQSVPLNYNVVAAPDAQSNNTYPSLLDQFTTIQLTGISQTGSYSCWMPANVRGTNPAATSLLYRIKSNAPTGCTYIDFQAVNQEPTKQKQKLSYRVYLGSNDSYDFNLYGNRDYTYKMNFKHTALPTNDQRVTIIDPIPASQSNSNFVPTANCFMVVPGGSFCFNPYKYAVEGNNNNGNTLLQGWCSTDKIQSVKVLWQTKENGDIGDPVLGVVSSATDHTNIVDLADGNNFENARIYCRVAPNTTGGSGLIAAYASLDGTGDPLWSWHIWVTDYAPDARGNIDVQTPGNKRKQKYTYNSDQLPMMDRNLGAIAGYIEKPANVLEMSKANGFHYQWGRKDPFPSSYSAVVKREVSGVDGLSPVPYMLNQYGPDGLSYVIKEGVTETISLRKAYQHPTVFYYWSGAAFTTTNSWNDTNGKKAFHDPCPSGWRVASKDNFKALFQSGSFTNNQWTIANATNQPIAQDDGGYVFYYQASGSGHTTYYRMTGYRPNVDIFRYIGTWGFIWTREQTDSGRAYNFNFAKEGSNTGINMRDVMNKADAHTIRCIQERE